MPQAGHPRSSRGLNAINALDASWKHADQYEDSCRKSYSVLQDPPEGLSKSRMAISKASMSSATCWLMRWARNWLTAEQMGLSLRLNDRLNCTQDTSSISSLLPNILRSQTHK